MAPPTRVRARGRPWLLYEEMVERFCDVFDHPHELVVHGRQDHASCQKVANGRHSIAETERKCCRGAPYVVFQREGSYSGRPRHVIGIRKGEVTLVLPRLLGSEGDTKLAPKADGGERLDGHVSQCQFSSHHDNKV